MSRTWEDAGIAHPALRALLPFPAPTAVQAAAIPLLLAGKDVVAEAVTGSGKTLAFVLPLIIRLRLRIRGDVAFVTSGGQQDTSCLAVIVSPTRELAAQTHRTLSSLVEDEISLLIGGDAPLDANTRVGRVAVGTPGRLAAVFSHQNARPGRRVEMLVLDEADRLLALGFAAHVGALLRALPKQRRTALFSATMGAEDVRALVRAGLRDPVRVTVRVSAGGIVPKALDMRYALVARYEDRVPAALAAIHARGAKKAILYVGTCAAAEYYGRVLPQLELDGFVFFSLHGRMEQKKRTAVMARFSSTDSSADTQIRVLVATDVAARGLDFADVDAVVHVDAPHDPETAVHRSGRTARAGRAGWALVLLAPGAEAGFVGMLERRGVELAELELGDSAGHDLFLSAYERLASRVCGSETPTCTGQQMAQSGDPAEHSNDLTCTGEENADTLDPAEHRKAPTCTGEENADTLDSAERRQAPTCTGEAKADNLDSAEHSKDSASSSDTPIGQPHSPPTPFAKCLRLISERDRDPLERGVRAFVAHVRHYAEHPARVLFPISAFDAAGLAYALGVLRVPRMRPPAPGRETTARFAPSRVTDVRFADESKNVARQRAIEARREARASQAAAGARQSAKRRADLRIAAASDGPADAPATARSRRREQDELDADWREFKKARAGAGK